MSDKKPYTDPIEFPLGTGGPFYRLQMTLRMIGEDRPNSARRAFIVLVITWLPLALLSLWEHVPSVDLLEGERTASVFTHASTYARFFVTLPLLIVAETAVRPQLEEAFRYIVSYDIVPEAKRVDYCEMLLAALEWRESKWAEFVILILSYGMAHMSVKIGLHGHQLSWIHTGSKLTLPGIWYAWVSLPMLQFLMLRWLFRIIIWWITLYRLVQLGLQIHPGHPDQRGGLAFIGDSVKAYSILALALSAASAGAVADFMINEGAGLNELKVSMIGAPLMIVLLFVLPLFVFLPAMLQAKEHAIRHYEGLAEIYLHAFAQKWTTHLTPTPTADAIAEPDFSSMTDMITLVQAVREMKLIPLTRDGLIPLLVAVILPFIPIAMMVFPLNEIIKDILHVFLGME